MQTIPGRHRVLVMAVTFLLLQGCGGPKSSSTSGPTGGPMPTNRMSMDLTVESSEPGSAVVRANLNDGHTLATSYRLDGGDFLEACVIGQCRSMADNDSVFEPDYIARLNFQPGVDYVVKFDRRKAQDAPNTRVSLPPAFTIVTPANRQQVTDGDVVTVSWAPTGAPADVYLLYEADCTFMTGPHGFSFGSLGVDSDRDGQQTVDIDRITSFARSNATSPMTRCDIEVTVRHELRGSVDPAFRGGSAVGIVSRAVTLDYVPR
ncbi:MAG TPA: hypothetical protein VFP37_08415 [Steroidobacteraceae bacterium]|nr:hypothetical protein [Steroidobacteraceae bacterium]